MATLDGVRAAVARVENRIRLGFDRFVEFTIDVIHDRRSGGMGRYFALFLDGLSRVFDVLVRLRLRLYQQRILRNHHLGCLVIVVGNLTVGGTGKTPVVEKLARSLVERGRTVAILSRGYMSRREPVLKKWWRMLTHLEPPPPKVVSDGTAILLDSETAGDEPYMLARNLPGVLVLVDKDRVKAGLHAIKKYHADTLILDDGYQYFALKDHLQLLMIDKTNPFGNGRLLPRGILREPIRHLRRASYIFVTKSDGVSDPELTASIRRYKPDAELIECTHRPRYLQTVFGDGRLALDQMKGKRIGAFCGIASPESFERYLVGFGARVEYKHWYRDHHRFLPGELEQFFREAVARELDMVVTTEKDAVRVPIGFQSAVPFYYLRVEVEIINGVADFEEAVSRICFPKKPMAATRQPFVAQDQAFGGEK